MQSTQSKPDLKRRQSAFSLVEMLVVIAIMSILMTAGSIGLSGMTGKGVSSGVATAEAAFSEARALATSKNLRTCVLVLAANLASNGYENDCRKIFVAYEKADPQTGLPTNPGLTSDPTAVINNPESLQFKWILASRGVILPEQTYFSKVLSQQADGSPIATIQNPLTGTSATYNNGKFFIYRFTSQGLLMPPKTWTAGTPYSASFVIGNGRRKTTADGDTAPPSVLSSSKNDFGGFKILRNGRTNAFRSPDQISGAMNLAAGANF
jgi:prepilin-type N-terminal cleavage/methylation domain-containing protein